MSAPLIRACKKYLFHFAYDHPDFRIAVSAYLNSENLIYCFSTVFWALHELDLVLIGCHIIS